MEKQDGKTVSRREVIKLSGIAAALGAGLGITSVAEAGQNPGIIQEKHNPGQLQFKFYTTPDASGKQALLLSVPISPAIQKRLMTAPEGRIQWKVEMSPTAGTLVPAVQKRSVIMADAIVQMKWNPVGDRGLRR